jgi:serine/threonine protein kinase
MVQIADAVKYLFTKGILHRDLKPANTLRSEKGWKIADFGFAMYAER